MEKIKVNKKTQQNRLESIYDFILQVHNEN